MSAEYIGKYEIVTTLGRGSMGLVYKARDPEIGRLVAVKTLRSFSHGAEAAKVLERFRQEARSAGKLQHPNIVTIYETGKSDMGSPYIVMEYIEGVNLALLLRDSGRLEIEEGLHYLGQLAGAIDYAHRQNVYHRDIKPSNVIITSDYKALLLDFGVARARDQALTPVGDIAGTPSYMSPEHIRGEGSRASSDQFAFSVMAFELLTGHKCFCGRDFVTVVNNILHKPPCSFSELGVSLPDGVEEVFARALAKRREERFFCALELVNRLAKACDLQIDGSGLLSGFVPTNSNLSKLSKEDERGLLADAYEVSLAEASSGMSMEPLLESGPSEVEIKSFSELKGSLNEQKKTKAPASYKDEKSKDTFMIGQGWEPVKESIGEPKRRGNYWRVSNIFFASSLLAAGLFFGSQQLIAKQKEGNNLESSGTKVLDSKNSNAYDRAKEVLKVRPAIMSTDDLSRKLIDFNKEPDDQYMIKAIEEAFQRKEQRILKYLDWTTRSDSYEVKLAILKGIEKEEFPTRNKRFEVVSILLNDADYLVRAYAAKVMGKMPNPQKAVVKLQQRLGVEESAAVVSIIEKVLKRLEKEVE